MPGLSFRPMTAVDLEIVAQLGIDSKRSWGYDAHQMRTFTEELTLSAESLTGLLHAEVACLGEEVVGYYTIHQNPGKEAELEHLFIAPDRFRQGIGSALFRRAMDQAARRGVAKLTIIADPNSTGFYEKFGAKRIGDTN